MGCCLYSHRHSPNGTPALKLPLRHCQTLEPYPLPRPDPRPEIDNPSYQILENTLQGCLDKTLGGIIVRSA